MTPIGDGRIGELSRAGEHPGYAKAPEADHRHAGRPELREPDEPWHQEIEDPHPGGGAPQPDDAGTVEPGENRCVDAMKDTRL
jgi:hypothetical protein